MTRLLICWGTLCFEAPWPTVSSGVRPFCLCSPNDVRWVVTIRVIHPQSLSDCQRGEKGKKKKT